MNSLFLYFLIIDSNSKIIYPNIVFLCASIATILGTADFLSQTFIENKPSYDLKRMSVNFTVGFCAGPWLFVWFNKMQPKIIQTVLKQPIEKPIYNWQTKELCVKKLLLKMSTDYFICFPVMQLLYHLIFNTLYNNSIQSILQAFDTKVSFSLSNHYQAWPIASCVIHLFVPLYLKAIFVRKDNTIAIRGGGERERGREGELGIQNREYLVKLGQY